jgi:hypothetical protein
LYTRYLGVGPNAQVAYQLKTLLCALSSVQTGQIQTTSPNHVTLIYTLNNIARPFTAHGSDPYSMSLISCDTTTSSTAAPASSFRPPAEEYSRYSRTVSSPCAHYHPRHICVESIPPPSPLNFQSNSHSMSPNQDCIAIRILLHSCLKTLPQVLLMRRVFNDWYPQAVVVA